ncbi:glucosaminidase domain-containing protein [Pseudarthrobacter chlorophenolicus]|uniref:glucosaminidase domain-containing protein n=1 Tax=Pseudarthrobacter chlorophenolicus TaxID=85085 RepID=UPI000A477104|nr:glucosaminidase domain-containing protein [Pseudarthrobacter chlorophenolicus]
MEDYSVAQLFAINGNGEAHQEHPGWPVKQDVFSLQGHPDNGAGFTEDFSAEGGAGDQGEDFGADGGAAETGWPGTAEDYDNLSWGGHEDLAFQQWAGAPDLQEGQSDGGASTWEVQEDFAAGSPGPDTETGAAPAPGAYFEDQPGTMPPGRLVVDRLPLLRIHRGTAPDLLLKWNSMPQGTTAVDVVVHLHGYSGRRAAMSIIRDKEPASGLDFADPEQPVTAGRTTPTLAVLPRGHYFGGNSGSGYSFPALTKAGALQQLVATAIDAFNKQTGSNASQGKLIITAHSGGGAPLMAILRHTDPDEVHTFDALYSDPSALIAWARRRVAAGSGALRVVFRPGEPTARNSERVAKSLKALGAGAPFRVESTKVPHNDIPKKFGWRLLADPSAALPGTTAREAEADGEDLYFAETGWRFGEDSAAEADPGEAYDAGASFEEEAGAVGQSSAPRDEAEPAATESGDGLAEDSYGEDSNGESPGQEAGEAEAGEWQLAAEQSEAQDIGEHEVFPSGASLGTTSGRTGEGEEHWDPNNTGLPLYETGPALRSRKLSPNFTVGELVFSGNQYAEKARISPVLVAALQKLRDRVGRPVRITSGYRSWERNVAVYRNAKPPKKPTLSRHCSGQAADVTVAGMSGLDIAKAAVDVLGDGIGVGIGAGFAHIDVRGKWTAWTYLSGSAGAAAVAAINAHRTARKAAPAPQPAPQSSDRAAGRVVRGTFVRCATGAQPGARAMADQWKRLTGRQAGTFNCRKTEAGTPSLHGEGRSVDLYARVDRPAEKAQAEAYVAWMQSNAVELQVAYIIWNHNQWSWARRADGWRPYTQPNKHTDHIHVDLSWEGARNPSPLFGSGVPGLGGGPSPAPQPPVPPNPAPPNPAPKPGGNVPAHVRDFVNRYGLQARRGEQASGVPWLVTLGQAALESGWGKKAPRFNFFGIKAKDTIPESQRQLLQTREVLGHPNGKFPQVISVTQRPDGKYNYVVLDWFRAYQSAEESFADHGGFLRRNSRYRPAFEHTADPYAFARAVAAAGYATDPSYAATLTSVLRLIERAA